VCDFGLIAYASSDGDVSTRVIAKVLGVRGIRQNGVRSDLLSIFLNGNVNGFVMGVGDKNIYIGSVTGASSQQENAKK
jgi:hypothetical protein